MDAGRRVVTSAGGVSYALFEGADGLEQLKDAWEALETISTPHIFQTHAYAQLWQRTVGAPTGATPLIVTLREGDRVVGIFPACRVKQRGMRLLTWLGGPLVLDYGDVLFDAEAAETSVDEFVGESLKLLARQARGAALWLTNVRDDARAIEPLRARLRVLKTTSAPYVPISGTWEEYIRSRGKSHRRHLRRARRDLEAVGSVETAMLPADDPQVASTVGQLVAFQRARFNASVVRTNLFDENYVRYRTEQAMGHPASRVSRIKLDGVTIAASLQALYNGRLYCMLAGFDSTYADYSPGLLLHEFLVRSCFENGWNPCDFCWGDEPHKFLWTDVAEPLTSFVGSDAKGAIFSAAAVASRRLAEAFGEGRKKPAETPTAER